MQGGERAKGQAAEGEPRVPQHRAGADLVRADGSRHPERVDQEQASSTCAGPSLRGLAPLALAAGQLLAATVRQAAVTPLLGWHSPQLPVPVPVPAGILLLGGLLTLTGVAHAEDRLQQLRAHQGGRA